MPTGKPVPNMMDNEVVALFYTCLKNYEGAIDFKAVATALGMKDAAFAKTRLQRVMKAQEKNSPQPGHGAAKAKQSRGVTGKPGRAVKKRKVDAVEEQEPGLESEGRDESGENATNGASDDGERV